jgi:hypothetical protein
MEINNHIRNQRERIHFMGSMETGVDRGKDQGI